MSDEGNVKEAEVTIEGEADLETSPDNSGTLPAQDARNSSYYPTEGKGYRAPVETELQKFGKKEQEQLKLFTSPDIEERERNIEVTGLNFKVSQDKAFEALQKILADTDYQGDPRVGLEERFIEARGGTYKLPGILINWADFYEAYGLKRGKNGKYTNRRQVKKAKEALESLAKPWRITVKQKKDNGKYDVVTRDTPLIQISKGYYDREKEEIKRIEDGDSEVKADKLLIRYKPIFIDKIGNFFLFKPSNLHKEIREAIGNKRYSPAILRFIWWLNTINYGAKRTKDYDFTKNPHKIGKKKLAYRLRLDNYIERRQWNYIDKRLKQACKVAKEINFLLDYDLSTDPIKLWPNPKRCSRLGYELERQGKLSPEMQSARG